MISDIDRARRLARTVISDIAIYSQGKVEDGIKNDTIFDVLKDEIEEGKKHFLEQIDTALPAERIFNLALADVLIKRAGKIDSSIWR